MLTVTSHDSSLSEAAPPIRTDSCIFSGYELVEGPEWQASELPDVDEHVAVPGGDLRVQGAPKMWRLTRGLLT